VGSYGTAQAEIDGEGGEQGVGDHRVSSLVEQSDARWEEDPGNLTLREPGSGETNHIVEYCRSKPGPGF